ncbi:MAG: bifunctional phosphoglucose/phosphomannose isomerase [Minisyncoccia bacterium]
MATLDDLQLIKKLDREKMVDFIVDLPKQCLKAYQSNQKIGPPYPTSEIKNLIVCGLGGSAIGGDLIKSIIVDYLSTPLFVIRDYRLPNYVQENSLVILVSYSGQTVETLSCAQDALKRKSKVIVLASGGDLKKIAQKNHWPIFEIDYQSQPRAALAWLTMPVLAILEKLNLINLENFKIEESLKLLDQFNQSFYPNILTEKNIAKYLAYFCFDHFPVIVASEKFSAAARRWKNQFNENSKNFAFWETLPENLHNTIEGDLPRRLKDEIVFLFFDSSLDESKLCQSAKIWQKLLDQENIRWEAVPSFGNNLFLANFAYVLLGDWVSFYLAILNQVDPTPVEKIKWLKSQL